MATSRPEIIQMISKRYPQKGMVDLGNPEDTLIATMLSAQTTDAQVLKIFPGFRKQFPDWLAITQSTIAEVAKPIASINYYRTKAKHLHAMAHRILDEFHGKVPRTMEALLTLPGVGRKTASCVLWYGFGIPAMAVDTHVYRIAKRLGWATGSTPSDVEAELCEHIPSKYWGDINRSFIPFGRDICKAQCPECYRCPLAKWCSYEPKTEMR